AGDRDDHGAAGQLPGEADLLRGDAAGLADLREGVAQVAGAAHAAQRRPGEEGEAEFGADVDLRLAGAEPRRVLVLHAHQAVAEDGVGGPDLLRVRVGDPGHLDLAGVVQVLQRADGLLVRDLRVGTVVLVEADALHAQGLQRAVAGLLEVLGAAVYVPAAAGRAHVAALGGHEHVVGGAGPE